jgi:hypothetical protein
MLAQRVVTAKITVFSLVCMIPSWKRDLPKGLLTFLFL